MTIGDLIKRRMEMLLASPGEELGRWARFLRFQIYLWRFCARRLNENNAMAMSSALSFRTLLAMIPALVLAIIVVKSMGMLEDSKERLREILDATGVGGIAIVYDEQPIAGVEGPQERRISAADQIIDLVGGVEKKLTFGRIGPVGGAFLIWTALTLLTTVERSLNRIYGARHSRGVGRRVVLYWSVLTLGPIILILVQYISDFGGKIFQSVPVVSWVLGALGWLGPVLVGIVLLAAVYKLMPNTQVGFQAAVGGALVAVPLWLVSKWGFSLYVRHVGSGSVYGALGLLPIFLIWLHLSWWTFLFGAQLSHTAAHLTAMQAAERSEHMILGPRQMLAAAIAVVLGYREGCGPVRFEQVAARLNLSDEAVQILLDRLTGMNVVCPVEGFSHGAYVPARPVSQVSVLEIMDVAGSADEMRGPYEIDVAEAVDRVTQESRKSLGELMLGDVVGGS